MYIKLITRHRVLDVLIYTVKRTLYNVEKLPVIKFKKVKKNTAGISHILPIPKYYTTLHYSLPHFGF